MPCRQLSNLLFATGMTSLLVLAAPLAQASARTLPPAPFDAPQYSAQPIQIPQPPPTGASRKTKTHALEAAPLALKRLNGMSAPDLGAAACAPDPLRLPNANGFNAANQLERLRATADGTVLPENRQLSKARQQRLQANAAWQMGLLTLHGICSVLNTADAAVWFERAQRLGEPLAPAGLAWCEIEGCKASANPAAAGRWVAQLRSVDAPRALYLQWLMQSRMAPLELPAARLGSPGNAASTLQNRQLLASAAQQGDTNAKIELGLDSVYLNDLPEALAFFKSAAPRSAAAAINAAVAAERLKNANRPPPANNSNNANNANIGNIGNGPSGPSASTPGNLNSYGSASRAVLVKPQSALDNLAQAQRYHRGDGVPSNYTEAIRLYQLAQNQGNASAKKMLELIFSRPTPNGQIDLAWMQQLAQVDLNSISPTIDKANVKQNLKREPTPLFELVPQQWRKYAAAAISA